MSPQHRKAMSEAKLRSHGIAINEHLPMTEAERKVKVRSKEEVLRRLVALWAVVNKAFLKSESQTAAYVTSNEMESWPSKIEREFLFNKKSTERDGIHFSWQLEALYLVAWFAGLLECNELPNEESSVKPILHLFPSGNERPERLRNALELRSKREVLDRADLLYRLHWAVRNAELTGLATPDGIDGGVVREWHRAVNWIIRYDGEDDWDHIGTDT